MDEDKDLDVSDEEQIADDETGSDDEDDLRDKLAEDMGLDPEDDAELLDKVLKRELDHRKKLSGAIKQKIKLREKLKANTPPAGKAQNNDTPNFEELVSQKLSEELEKRDLESLDLADELKEEVTKLAKMNGISVREASRHPYIEFRKQEVERAERIKAATPKRKGRGTYVSNVDPSKPLNPADFDFNSEEGIKAWKEAKALRAKHQADK